MADLPSILGGMAQGFLDFGKSAVDLFGTGGASIADLIESARTGKVTTRNSDDFRKWLYDTNDVKDAAAKGLGTALNGVQTVSDYIPGIGAVTRNPLFNAGQGALGGLADEFKMYGKDYDLGRAGQRAAVGAGGALASTGLADALKGSGNALLKSGTAQGLARGAVGGAIGAGGYTAIDGGNLGDVANSALQGAGMGAALGGTMGALQDLRPAKTYDMALTDEEKAARIANAKNMLANEQDPERIAELNNQIKDLGGTIGNAPSENMKLYRGISAPDDATLQRYIDEMKDPNIAPTTYSGGSAYGQGYYFTPDEGLARYYASESGLPSTAIMEIEVPRNRFTEISKENGNRPADFDLAAIKRGVPEDIRYETGLKDFNDYLDNNGYWGSKTGGENPTYTIMRNDAVLNAKRIDAPSLETALAADDMAVNSARLTPEQEAYFKDSVIRDENGNLIPMYHGTRGNFTVFGDNAPSGTSNSHASVGNWFTPTKEGAKNFAESIWYGDGEPTVMETYLNVKNPKIYESVDNSEAVAKLRKELDSLRFEPKNLSDTNFYHRNIYDSNQAMRMVETGDVDMALKWLTDKGYDSDKAAEYIDELVNLNKLNSRRKSLQDSISDLKYGDAYERFRTDLYKVGGQTAEDANLGGIGMALNDRDTIQKYVDGLKSEGYDGILIKGTRYDADTMGGPNDQYVVFDSNQIKSTNNLNPTENPDIRYSKATPGQSLEKTLANGDAEINRIGSADVAPVDPSTLPESIRAAKGFLDKDYIKDIENYSGKKIENMTDSELIDYALSQKPEKDREILREAYSDIIKGGSTARDVAESVAKNAYLYKIGESDFSDGDAGGVMDYLLHHGAQLREGRTKAADIELSDRLGIAPGNTFMRDNANPYDSYGSYDPSSTTISIGDNTVGENAIGTVGHERLHSFQVESLLDRYDKEVLDAYKDLSKDLDKYIKTDAEIAKLHADDPTDLAYWGNKDEQQARMLQQYLENKNFTKTGSIRNRAKEWGSEINPAFDKFFDKLRDLSKRGVALPALTALFGGGALMANQQKDKEEVR